MERLRNQVEYTIDCRKDKWLKKLKDLVAIRSVSEDNELRPECVKALVWTKLQLQKLGFATKFHSLGKENVYAGDTLPLKFDRKYELPDVLTAVRGHDITLKTLLIYAHLDVKQASELDKWPHNPFDMQITSDYITGRGVSDSKGPLIGWLLAIDSYLKSNQKIPINIKFLVEVSQETGSEGVHELLNNLKQDFFKDIDFVAMSCNYWLTQHRPCLSYGLRGLIYFYVEIDGSSGDPSERILHSGTHGGAVPEPMTDLVALMGSLVDRTGRVLIPNINDDLAPVDEEELKRLEEADFQPRTYERLIGVRGLYTYNRLELLRRRWCLPSISIHGLEGSYDKPGGPTWMPRKVLGKFSLRIVPDQAPKKIIRLVTNYLESLHKERSSPNQLVIKTFYNGRPFLGDVHCPGFLAAARAIHKVWTVEPEITREGASIPIATSLEEYIKQDVILIPMGQSLDYHHEPAERLRIENFVKTSKVFANFFVELMNDNIQFPESEEETKRQIQRANWRKRFFVT